MKTNTKSRIMDGQKPIGMQEQYGITAATTITSITLVSQSVSRKASYARFTLRPEVNKSDKTVASGKS